MTGDRKGINGCLEMLKRLLDSKYGVSINRLAEESNLSDRTVRRHFKTYRDAGFNIVKIGLRGDIYYKVTLDD